MSDVMMDKRFVLAFRLLMGWTFLYAGTWQVPSSDFSAATFLAHTKTFHDVYAPLTSPAIAPVLTFLVSWGHLLIGPSRLRPAGPHQRRVRRRAAAGLLDRAYGLSLHRKPREPDHRLPHRLCDVDCLAGRGECRPCLGVGMAGSANQRVPDAPVRRAGRGRVKSRASPGSAHAGRRTWAEYRRAWANRSPRRVLNCATPGHGSHRRAGSIPFVT